MRLNTANTSQMKRYLIQPGRIFIAAATVFLVSNIPVQAAARPNAAMKSVLDQLAALKPKPIEKLTPARARRQPLPSDAVRTLLRKLGKSTAPEAVGGVTNTKVAGVNVRVYKPRGRGPFPVIVYAHGGGFVIASIQDYDSSCRALTNAANAIVVSVGYRLAPEKRLPAQPEEAYAVTQWVFKNADKWGGDRRKVAVAGESAGGAIATSICLMSRARKTRMPVHQLLVYPFVDASSKSLQAPSVKEYAYAKPLNRAMLKWFASYALPTKKAGDSPKYSPLLANLKGLPPATIILAEIDPLRSQGAAYAAKLQKAGVPVRLRLYRGVTHEFFGMGAVVPEARQAVKYSADGLRAAFAGVK